MTCAGCGKALPEATSRRRFCGPACRAEAWRRRQAESAAAPLDRATLLLGELQAAVREAREALAAREQKGRRR